MADHSIFYQFWRATVTASGLHAYDFLGGTTRVAYKKGWASRAPEAGESVTPNLPAKNQHYLDWIVVLTAATKAAGTFRMAEFGAGWAHWLVRGALAAQRNPYVSDYELMAVEADPTHLEWAHTHFRDNGLDPEAYHLIHGAVSDKSETLRFPLITNPDVVYGASLRAARTMEQTIEVRGYTVNELLDRFTGPVDCLHIDIQGAEYEALPPAMDQLATSVRSIKIGTHINQGLHDEMATLFRNAGWVERLNFGRDRTNNTPWGDIKTSDGFLWFQNPIFA